MTISLNRNSITPAVSSQPLLARFAQAVAQFKTMPHREAPLSQTRPQSKKPLSNGPDESPKHLPIPAAMIQEASQMTMEASANSIQTTQAQTTLTRPLWRAWREKSELGEMTVLRVAGLCPGDGINGRLLLQESVIADSGHHWGGEGAKSGLLVLERLVVPPALGEECLANPQRVNIPSYPWCYPWESSAEDTAEQPLLVTFRKEERMLRAVPQQIPVAASSPHYTRVTILPDGITIPIQE